MQAMRELMHHYAAAQPTRAAALSYDCARCNHGIPAFQQAIFTEQQGVGAWAWSCERPVQATVGTALSFSFLASWTRKTSQLLASNAAGSPQDWQWHSFLAVYKTFLSDLTRVSVYGVLLAGRKTSSLWLCRQLDSRACCVINARQTLHANQHFSFCERRTAKGRPIVQTGPLLFRKSQPVHAFITCGAPVLLINNSLV